jgi:uncharacterized phage-associated protein
MSEPPYDPRAVANLLLDLADRDGLPVTNLVLQKLLYFAHGHFLIRSGVPLVRGGFEAWTHGPVHPAVYQAFKVAGKLPIQFRAEARNFATGDILALHAPTDPQVRRHIIGVLSAYGHLPPGRLVDISHAPRAPWAATKNKAETSVALGLRISDNVIVECFKYHKVSVGPESRAGEPDEDTPLA